MKAKTRKWQYLKVIQGYVPGCGWSDYEAADIHSREECRELQRDYKAYKENEPGVSAWRIVRRRLPIGETFHA